MRECYKYLEGHDGMVAFSAGTRAAGCERDVNDVQFQVSLHVVFKDRQSHDAYQTTPRHKEFITRNKAQLEAGQGLRFLDREIRTGEGGRSAALGFFNPTTWRRAAAPA